MRFEPKAYDVWLPEALRLEDSIVDRNRKNEEARKYRGYLFTLYCIPNGNGGQRQSNLVDG